MVTYCTVLLYDTQYNIQLAESIHDTGLTCIYEYPYVCMYLHIACVKGKWVERE